MLKEMLFYIYVWPEGGGVCPHPAPGLYVSMCDVVGAAGRLTVVSWAHGQRTCHTNPTARAPPQLAECRGDLGAFVLRLLSGFTTFQSPGYFFFPFRGSAEGPESVCCRGVVCVVGMCDVSSI